MRLSKFRETLRRTPAIFRATLFIQAENTCQIFSIAIHNASMIYCDNAATSWPKPPDVLQAMTAFLQQTGANPGRAGHRLALEAGRVVYQAREAVAELLRAPDPVRVVFGPNVTFALNVALHGLLEPGDHVITSGMEHNAMMRPLRTLEHRGVEVTVTPCGADGLLDPCDIERRIRKNTVLIALNHASNVVGTIQPITEVGRIARQHNLFFLVDTAQTAGAYPIDMQQDCIDLLAFTGHKTLYGPPGTGGFIIGERVSTHCLKPLVQGGTGSHSAFEEQPDFLPDRYESGTLNTVGLAGLQAGIQWILTQGLETIREREMDMTEQMLAGLRAIPGVIVYGTQDAARRTATISFTIWDMDIADIGLRLDDDYGIQCRVGLHCAPAAHKTLGTFPTGTVRLGLGAFTTPEDVEQVVRAVEHLSTQ